MEEEELPNDPLAGDVNLDGPTVADFNDLKARLARIEAALDSDNLGDDAAYRAEIIRSLRQRIDLKWRLAAFGVFVVFAMLVIVYHAAHGLLEPDIIPTLPPSFSLALVVAPIVSATTITALMLIGAFRSFKEGDGEKVDLQSLAVEGVRQLGQ